MSNEQTLTDNEVMKVSELLSRLNPGLYPFPIFVQVARLTTLTTIELVSMFDEPKSPLKV